MTTGIEQAVLHETAYTYAAPVSVAQLLAHLRPLGDTVYVCPALNHRRGEVLYINELANALKPVVLPGEFMKVFILKEGKEYNQGVAYLDDGTMVVVDNARRLIGKTSAAAVTSVLQTTAGKMIFGRHIEAGAAPAAPGPDRDDARNQAKSAVPPQAQQPS